MNIASLAIALKKKSRGLELLVDSLLDPRSNTLCPQNFRPLIKAALESLETDNSIDAKLADQLATHLIEAEDAFQSGLAVWASLERVVETYQKASKTEPGESKNSNLLREKRNKRTQAPVRRVLLRSA